MQFDTDLFCELVPIDSLDAEQTAALASLARIKTLPKGETLFQFGDQDPDTLYLLEGTVELEAADGMITQIHSGDAHAKHPLAPLKPRRAFGRVTSRQATLAYITSDLLDRALALPVHHTPASSQNLPERSSRQHSTSDSAWMMSVMQTPSFLRLPAANIQSLFERLHEMPVQAGQVIIKQGEPGDFYYLIKQGLAEVTRFSGNSESRLGVLESPAGFGEEALLTSQPRNASVAMQTEGILMRLAKHDFQDLLREPLLNWVDLNQASDLVRSGAVRIDVRSESEFSAGTLTSALNIPLYLLRLKLTQLDPARPYILYCDTGTRSAAAGFIMSQQGFNVSVLRGGLAVTGI